MVYQLKLMFIQHADILYDVLALDCLVIPVRIKLCF